MYKSIGIISLLALTAPALADGLSYNYLEGSFQRVDIDSPNIDGDGFSIGGSVELGDNAHVFADYGSTNFDFGIDINELAVGVGFHTELTPTLDFVANFAYLRLDADANGFSLGDEDGIGAEIGLRSMLSDRLELAGFIQYADLGDGGDDTSFRGEAWYSFAESFALGLNVGAAEDVLRYGIGARYYFGN